MPDQSFIYTREALLDVHTRAHRSFRKLLEHCAAFDAAALNRELPGFGYPTLRLQFHHVIGGEEYWIGVIRGNFRVEDDEDRYPTIDSLEGYREATAAATAAYLGGASPAELNTAREMLTWHGTRPRFVPARIVMRTQAHIYQHQGQVAAMSRLLERPIPSGLDFPLD